MVQRIELTVRRHAVVLTSKDGRWNATVDGVPVDRWFPTSADAWSAAVALSERFDSLSAAARVAHT